MSDAERQEAIPCMTDVVSGRFSAAGLSSSSFTRARKAGFSIRLPACFRLERQLGQGVTTVWASMRAARSRLRTQRAADSSVFTACAGVEPQQFQSGISCKPIFSARQTARVDIS